MTERRDVQKLVLEYLSSRWEDTKVVETTEVREKLGLTVDQMKQAKGCLLSKELVINPGKGLIALNKKPGSRDFICKLLTKKKDEFRDEIEYWYCPVKKTYISSQDRLHFCSKMLYTRFVNKEPELYWKPNCENWSGKR
jgi:hypothetical protein